MGTVVLSDFANCGAVPVVVSIMSFVVLIVSMVRVSTAAISLCSAVDTLLTMWVAAIP